MQRRSTKNTRGPNANEKDFQSWLKFQPCCVGGNGITEVHHCKGATFKHRKVLIGHWFCIPLSQSAHARYHAGTKNWRICHGSQSDLWSLKAAQYENETGKLIPNDVKLAIQDYGQ